MRVRPQDRQVAAERGSVRLPKAHGTYSLRKGRLPSVRAGDADVDWVAQAPEYGRTTESWRWLLTRNLRDEVKRLIARAQANACRPRGREAVNLADDEDEKSSEDEQSYSNHMERPGEASRGRDSDDESTGSMSEGPGSEEDEALMGCPREMLTNADYRMAARYIASKDPEEWNATSKIPRWTEFAQQVRNV